MQPIEFSVNFATGKRCRRRKAGVARGTPLNVYGFFGGPDGGWDHRTWSVVAAYILKIYLASLVVKRFDMLVKNICSAGACLLTYWWATSVTCRSPGLFVNDEGLSRLLSRI